MLPDIATSPFASILLEKVAILVTPSVPATVVLPEAATTLNLLVLTLKLPVTSVTPPIDALPVVDWNSIFVVPDPLLICSVLEAPWNTILSSNLDVLFALNVPSTSSNPPILTSSPIPAPPATTKSPVVLDVEFVFVVSFKLPATRPLAVPLKTSEVLVASWRNENPPTCPPRSVYESS